MRTRGKSHGGAPSGPNSPPTVVENLHQSPAAPLPTHMNIEQTAPGGGLTLTCEVIAERSKQTTRTLILGAPGTAQSNRKRPWRRALFWAVADVVTGSHDADLIANVDGSMVSICMHGCQR